MHGGLSPDLQSMEQIRRVMRPTDVPDTGKSSYTRCFKWQTNGTPLSYVIGLLCDLLWSDPDKDITGWSENDRGVSFTFGPDVVSRFLQKHDMDLICRAHQVCGALLYHPDQYRNKNSPDASRLCSCLTPALGVELAMSALD